MKNTTNWLISMLLLSAVCYGQHPHTYSQPIELTDEWKTNHLTSQDIDTSLIYRFLSQINGADHKLHSMLLIRNNRLVLETYFNGHQTNQTHDLRSTSKSIRSILLGIAIDKGFIDDINDPISKYLKSPQPKKNLDARKEAITIKHLITMASGLDCNDWDPKSKGQEDKVYKKKDWLQYTLDLPMLHQPGEVSHYCSMGVILMTEIISQSSGMSIDEFAEAYLFKPLGIKNIRWGHTSDKEVIASARRLYMTPRDMAKIGQLVLNQGKWKGEQIVSEKWISASTTPQTKITGLDYGYLWWNIPFKMKDKTIIAKTATGNGGQYIMIIPEMELIAIFTGGAYNSQEDKLPFAIMQDVVLPSIAN